MNLISLTTVTKNGTAYAYTRYFNVNRIKNIRAYGARAQFDYDRSEQKTSDDYVVSISAITLRQTIGDYNCGLKITLKFEYIDGKLTSVGQQTIDVDKIMFVYTSNIGTKSYVEYYDIKDRFRKAIITESATRVATIAETGDPAPMPTSVVAITSFLLGLVLKYSGNTAAIPEDKDLRLRSLDADYGEYKIGDFVKETFDAATGTWTLIGTL